MLYAEDEEAHGNFYQPAYRRILRNPDWRDRLRKAYTASARVPHRHARSRRELDTACSSDALLMSVFCAPGTLRSKRLRAMLSIDADAAIEFGVRTRVPLIVGYEDRTEVDLVLGQGSGNTLFIEAKLTESGFQAGRPSLLARYPDFEDLFHVDLLPRNGRGEYLGYQLIRSILAAYHHNARFALIADARRPDLREQAFRIFAAVQNSDLRSRLHLYTWQEIAACVSRPLQLFLREKYGITAG